MNHTVEAIVLAGGKTSPEMVAAMGVHNRALVELAPGRTMLDHVVAALLGSKSVKTVHVVGDVPQPAGTTLVAPGETLLDNIMRGLDAAAPPPGDRALVVTSDIPFITPEAVDDFVTRAAATDGDFCYPIIPMDAYNREFGDMKRTTLKLRDGHFTGGNMVLLNPERILANKHVVMAAYDARKDVFALGKMLGWGQLFRIILSQVAFPNLLSVAELEVSISKLFGEGASARAVVTEFASIGTDVDKPDDVAFARQRLHPDGK
ncbi:MAG TPA: nucleotidyltransferase family protein [Capsulimonadaceae bacterium]|jgi:molybdopterin-guanine dinucleotide biosynthesis protein A